MEADCMWTTLRKIMAARTPIRFARYVAVIAMLSVGVCLAPARADQVKIHAVGRVVFHDPDQEIHDHPGTMASLNGCRSPNWPIVGLPGAYVQLREEGWPSSPVIAEGWTDQDGNFDLKKLADGSAAVGDVNGKFYVQVRTQDTQPFNRVDVHTFDGVTYKFDSTHRGILHFDKSSPVQTVHIDVVDFDSADDPVLRCSATVYAHVRKAYGLYNTNTGRPRLPGDNGHVSVTFGWGTNGMWTYWNDIRIERSFDAWDLQSIYHEFGHRVAFTADSPDSTLAFLDDAARFNYARSHDGTEVRNRGYAWAEGWADFNHAVYRPEYRPILKTLPGGSGNGVDNDVENDIARKLLQYAEQCGGGPSGVEAAYKSFVDTLIANPGPELAAAHRTSDKPIHSFEHFAALHQARTSCAFVSSGSASSPIVSGNDRPDPSIASVQGGTVSIVRNVGGHFSRISSTDGQSWTVDAPAALQALDAGSFLSGPAAAVSSNGKSLHVFGRGQDSRIWRAYSADGGNSWQVAWAPIGEGVLTSAPAAAISADGKQLHVFGRGVDNKFWRAYSADGGNSWQVAWAPIGDGTFMSGPAAAISADGKHLHVFGRGVDNKFWHAYSSDGGNSWQVAWVPIGDGVFTSAPTAAMSADGKKLHVFGRGADNKFWRAYSGDGGATWAVAWSAMGEGSFISAPTAVVAPDGQHLRVFGLGNDSNIWYADSVDGASTWRVEWAQLPAAH